VRDSGAMRTAAANVGGRPAGDTTELVVVTEPTAIGFFPPPRDSADAQDDGYSEGVSHIRFAIEDAGSCLGRDSSQLVLLVDTAVRIRRGARIDTLRFSRVDTLSYGVYFVMPGREPYLVPHGAGPSTLIPAVNEEIPKYFGGPKCQRDSL